MSALRTLMGLAMAGLLTGLASTAGPASGEAFSVPVSDRVIEGEIEIPSDAGFKPVHFSAREGTMVTITYESTGRTDGWIPILDKLGQPTFRPFQILPGDKLKQAGSVMQVIVGDSGQFEIDGLNYRVLAEKVFEGNFPNIRLINPRGVSPDNLKKIYGKSGGGTCCVSCGGVTVCASSVDLDCGYCGTAVGRPFRQI